MGWVVNGTHDPMYPRERESAGTHSTRGWVGRRPVRTGAENFTPVGI